MSPDHVMDFMNGIAAILMTVGVLGLCFFWYLGTDRILVKREQRRRARLRVHVLNSRALRSPLVKV